MKKMKVIKLTVKDIVDQVPANGNQKWYLQERGKRNDKNKERKE